MDQLNNGWLGKIAAGIVRLRWLLLLVAIVLLSFTFLYPVDSGQPQSIEQMFGSADSSVRSYQTIKSIYGDRQTVLVVYRDKDLFQKDGSGLRKLSELQEKIESLPQVAEVLSLNRLEKALSFVSKFSNPFGSLNPLSGSNQSKPIPILDSKNELAASMLETFDGWTHYRKGDLAVLVCLLDPHNGTANSTRKTIEDLRKLVGEFPEAHVVGEPVMVQDGIEYLRRDGQWLQTGVMILLGLVILFLLQTVKWLVVTGCVVYWSNRVTVWLLAVMGFQQSMISSLLGSIIAVIGVATAIHLIGGYRLQRVKGETRTAAMRNSFVLLFPPIFWACLTDAAGFFSLAVAGVKAVGEFGMMMSVASLVTLSAICLICPGMILIGPTDRADASGMGQRRLEKFLNWTLSVVDRRPISICLFVAVFAATMSYGCLYMKVETDFTKNFRPGTPIMSGYEFVEEEFGGAGLIDISLPSPKFLDAKYRNRVRELQKEIRHLRIVENEVVNTLPNRRTPPADPSKSLPGSPAVAKVISVIDTVDSVQSVPSFSVFPADAIVTGMRKVLPQFMDHWYRWDEKEEKGYLRIFVRTKQQQPAEIRHQLIDHINKIVEKRFPKEKSTEISGMYILLSRLVDSLLDDYLKTTLMATATIGLLLLIALRDIRLTLVALVPNLFPIFSILGVMGWMDVRLNMGVAMIAAVSIGLSVDSSIHYLWSVKRTLRNRKKNRREQLGSDQNEENDLPSDQSNINSTDASGPVRTAQTRIGTALTYSSLTLIVGFMTLVTSEFVPTAYFGALVSSAMFGGLIGNLILLPALLRVIKINGNSTH